MKLKIIKPGPWGNIYGKRRTFKMDEVIEVGVDISDVIAETMLRCDYAVKLSDFPPKVETKSEVVESEQPKEEKKSSKKRGRKKKAR